MVITKMSLPRRTLLRALGVTVSLPLLDAMTPALPLLARTPASPVKRVGFVYVPNGAIMPGWVPTSAPERGFEFPRILKPVEAFRDRLVVVTGLTRLAVEG